jgi:hypothetical protein
MLKLCFDIYVLPFYQSKANDLPPRPSAEDHRPNTVLSRNRLAAAACLQLAASRLVLYFTNTSMASSASCNGPCDIVYPFGLDDLQTESFQIKEYLRDGPEA